MRKIISLFVIVCCGLLCRAQSYNVLLRQANDACAAGDYGTAVELYESLMQMYEKMPALQLLSADAYRLNLQYNEARALYQSLTKTSDKLYPESLFWLAQIEQLFGNKAEAQYYYYGYIHSNHKEFYERAMQELQRLQFVPENETITVTRDENSPFFHNYGVNLLNDTVIYNGVQPTKTSSYITFAPLEKKYEQLFSDNRFSYSDLQQVQSHMYVTRRTAPIPLEKAELCTVRDSAGILSLQPIENQPFANNGDANIHVHFAHYNKVEIIFFASDRKDGFGGFDIWYCLKNKHGEFEEAVNAGSLVNSADDEICPFFDIAHKRLYFSSDWHNGIGGFDIFVSDTDTLKVHETTVLQFATPHNVGTPINSSFNDFYYKQLNNKAYFTSNRPRKKPERTDYFYNSVFYYDLPVSSRHIELDTAYLQEEQEIAAQTRNDNKENVLEFHTTLFFRHDFPNEQSELSYLQEYEQYTMNIEERLAQLARADFSISNKIEEQQLRDFAEKQLSVNFKSLQQEIQNLANFAHNRITVELQASTSALGNYEYNQKLAERRTASVRNYIFEELQKAGIVPDSIIFGEKLPVIQTENTKNQQNDYLLNNASERWVTVRIFSY